MHNGEVHIWIALKRGGRTYSEWQGTYLNVRPDGSITRITRDSAYENELSMLIKGAD